jgi:serine O-acetyltransferase
MIQSYSDYLRFLRAEQPDFHFFIFPILFLKTSFKPTKRFLLLLRTCEYLKNVKPFLYRPRYWVIKYMKYRMGLKLGFSIPENVADEGLQLPHYGTIVINSRARLGKHCRIHVCVNIGASGGDPHKAPRIGNHVYVGPGAKIYGDIEIADRVAIAANAAVSTSFLNTDVLIGGVPAKEIGQIDITRIIKE